ncbi:Amidophosphoribosyltransferase [Toxocara canis]|uniref:Amidophosphoribosyltransferase n=1 Tax=Toxocara canis TaxID=6265 RepID=A0A0B2UTV2_TOXCA|nr:Amidophosphoribosyltransferase [Toxocara canis]
MCGILGLILAEGVTPGALAAIAVDGLTSLQHRGTESSGLVGSNGVHRNHFEIVKGCGLVKDAYSDESLSKFSESVALVGHNRYSTAGMKGAINCIQPFVVHTTTGLVAIAHNGELVDAKQKRKEILNAGVGLSTDTDSELIAQIISKSVANNLKCRTDGSCFGDICKELAITMSSLRLSYSLLVMTYDRIYALRDPYGNRPLCVGTLYCSTEHDAKAPKQPYAYMAVSESCALPSTALLKCEVKAGEIIEITRSGIRSMCQMKPAVPSFCIFEYIYFARCDSFLEGQQVQSVREDCGRILAEESSIDADIVSTVPDSATAASIGFAEKSGIRYEQVLHRNSYVGRSFIQPNTELRKKSVAKKFGVITRNVTGKRIVLIDDSIVRGNTMGIIVRLLKEHGAKEVHLRIASPPVKYPCFMGINIPSTKELIAANRSVDEISEEFGADSVRYLSIEGLQRAVVSGIKRQPNSEIGHCMACLTGQYPIDLDW